MKKLESHEPQNGSYSPALVWAQLMYMATIKVTPPQGPDTLLTIADETQFYGCIGLNQQVSCSLFLSDPNCRAALGDIGPEHCCEQSILVAPRYPRALPLLIAAVTYQAYLNGKSHLCFAGICQSVKTLRRLELDIERLGSVNLSVLPTEALRRNYSTWYESYGENKPEFYMLNTAKAVAAMDMAIECYARKHVEVANLRSQGWSSKPILMAA